MKRVLILLTLLSLLLVTSCELFMDGPKQNGKIYTINIGLDYQNASSDTLFGTILDAKELQKAFSAIAQEDGRVHESYLMIQEGATVPVIPNDDYPSKKNVEKYLTNLALTTTKDDLTIFTYSGHGEKQSGDLAFATTSSVSSNRMNPSELLHLMSNIKGKKLIILDNCFSGMFVQESPSSTNTVLNNSIQEFLETYYSSDKYTKPDLFVLTASAHADSYEMSFGTGANTHKHGVFTYALLEALGWSHSTNPAALAGSITNPPAAKNGRITVDGLFKYIKKNQALNTRLKLFSNWSEYQHPMTTGGPLDLVLFNL